MASMDARSSDKQSRARGQVPGGSDGEQNESLNRMKGKLSKYANIDLGLAVSALSLTPGERRSHYELAAFCGVSHSAIQQIEGRALRKLRNRFLFMKDPILKEAIEQVLGKSK